MFLRYFAFAVFTLELSSLMSSVQSSQSESNALSDLTSLASRRSSSQYYVSAASFRAI